MLGKTLKYEFKGLGRTLLPFFGLSIAVSALLRLILVISPYIWRPAGDFLEVLASNLGGLLIFSIILLTFVLLVMRFFRATTSDEAYLTFTLPVKTSTHIFSRLITGTVFTFLAILVCYICSLIFIPGFGFVDWNHLHTIRWNNQVMQVSLAMLPSSSLFSLYGLLICAFLLGTISTLLHVYAAIALGTNFHSKALGATGAFFGLQFVEAIIFMPVILFTLAKTLSGNFYSAEAFLNYFIDFTSPITAFSSVINFAWLVFGIVAAYTVLLSILHYFITVTMFSKKLNLE